jgi:hypothetical protein
MTGSGFDASVAHQYLVNNQMNRLQTDFLVPRMTWLTGAGTLLNLAGQYYGYNISATEEEADARALFSDWSMVGQDLRNAGAYPPST